MFNVVSVLEKALAKTGKAPKPLKDGGKLKQWAYAQAPEFIMTLWVFIFMFILMLAACIFRVFGIGWFRVDCSHIALPSQIVQDAVNFVLFWFEGTFILKILTNLKWSKAVLAALFMSVLTMVVYALLGEPVGALINVICFYAMPIMLLKDKSKTKITSTIRNSLALSALIWIYGLFMLYGRYEFNGLSAQNYVYSLLAVIDYKLLFVVVYLLKKLKGGVCNA